MVYNVAMVMRFAEIEIHAIDDTGQRYGPLLPAARKPQTPSVTRMRDPEMMVSILREMADSPAGEMILRQYLGMPEEQRVHNHHVDLLLDAGLAAAKSPSMVRITDPGYDFLNALDNNPRAFPAFMKMIQGGKTLLEAVKAIFDLL